MILHSSVANIPKRTPNRYRRIRISNFNFKFGIRNSYGQNCISFCLSILACEKWKCKVFNNSLVCFIFVTFCEQVSRVVYSTRLKIHTQTWLSSGLRKCQHRCLFTIHFMCILMVWFCVKQSKSNDIHEWASEREGERDRHTERILWNGMASNSKHRRHCNSWLIILWHFSDISINMSTIAHKALYKSQVFQNGGCYLKFGRVHDTYLVFIIFYSF